MSAEADLRRQDAEARRVAQMEMERPVVLEAGAGTGKTATLVARILAWCLDRGWEAAAGELVARGDGARAAPTAGEIAPRVLGGVLAITFTEAAATEMAERVGSGLASLARGGAVVGFEPALLGVPASELAARASALVAHLDHLAIATIHAFCRRLLARYPLAAGVHPNFQVDAEGEALEEALAETLDAELVARPEAFLELARRGLGPGEVTEAAAALLGSGMPPAALGTEPFSPAAAAAAGNELAVRAAALAGVLGARLAGAKRVSGALAVAELLPELVVAGQALSAGGWKALAGLRRLIEASTSAGNKLDKWAKGELSAAESTAVAGSEAELATAAQALKTLLRSLTALDPGLFTAARQLLQPVVAGVEARLRRGGAVTYAQLLALARDLLVGNPDICRAERSRLDQLLVDEFQDTDGLQCELVRALALDGAASERPGLFLVGDPKQSIYGWRSADLAAYDGFVAEVLAAGGRLERLAVNYRSLPAILAEVARLIAPVMERKVGEQPAFQPLVAAPAREVAGAATTAPAVEHWRPPAEVDKAVAVSALEAAAIAADLRQRHAAGMPWRDAALLLRSMTDLDVYLRALQEAGVPYAVARDSSYFRRREVQDAAALVRLVLDPLDDLALLTCLRTPWVGVPDAALAGLWRGGLPTRVRALLAPDAELESAIARLAAAVAQDVAGRAAEVPGLAALAGWDASLTAFAAALGRLRESFRQQPADVFVEELRRATTIEATEAARFLGPWRLANLDRFFRQLVALLDQGDEPAALLARLRRAVAALREAPEGRPAEPEADRVQVMTIHKAKGLDFRQVYLPQLHKRSRRGQRPQAAASWQDGAWQLELFGAASPGWTAVEEKQARLRAAEQVRLFYVALTRAKDRLVLLGRPAGEARGGDASFAQLVARRDPPPPGAGSVGEEPASAGDLIADGVRWLTLPAAAPLAAVVNGPPPPLPAPEEVARQEAVLAGHRAAAQERQERPFRGAASAEAHDLLAARRAADPEEVAATPALFPNPAAGEAERALAQRVGTAFHRLLERFDLAGEPDAALARGLADECERLAAEESGEAAAAAASRLRELVRDFAAGSLWRRFLDLRGEVLARELPVLLPPAETGPVGLLAGAVDLLYRDPQSGELVVADYKTDALAPGEVAVRAEIYRRQGEVYQRAVMAALDLAAPPRLELWFVALGEIRTFS